MSPPRGATRAGLRRRLGVPEIGTHRRFVGALAIDAIGSGVFAPVAVLYFLAVSGLPLARVGVAISISAAVALPVTLLVGHLVDIVGPRRILLLSNLIQATAYLLALAATSFPTVVLVTTLAACGQACFWGSYSPTVAALCRPGERELWFGFIGALRNLGFAVGGLAAGVAVAVGTLTAYHLIAIGNAISFLLAFALLAGEHGADDGSPAERDQTRASWSIALRDRDYGLLVLANFLYACASLALSYAMPVYAVHVLHLPGWIAGGIYLVNTVLVAGGQAPAVAQMAGHVRRTIVLAGNAAFALGFVLLALASRVSTPSAMVGVLLGAGVYTVGELLCGPVLTTIAVDSRPVQVRGRYLSVYQLSWNLAGIVCPAGFAWLLANSVTGVWWALVGIAALGSAVIGRLPRRLPVAGEAVTNRA